ncbi:MAG: hypothetical protein J0H54_06130, partial [Rhizobiales bacterium]|nr:hypothetical protein [Hyphomicrobiales bacterium]
MLVHLAEARHGAEIGIADARLHLAAVAAARADKGDAAAGDDDLLVFQPMSRMHRKQPADLDHQIRRALGQRHQGEMLANGNFVLGVEDQVVGQVDQGL